MNTLDSVFGMNLFMNYNSTYSEEFNEDYSFMEREAYYLINELLEYDDYMYRNDDFALKNAMIYLNNIIKKLVIATYYELTDDKGIVDCILSNKLYGVNAISSNFLSGIINKPKGRFKEM